MRTSTTPVRMTFICDQDWDAMTPTERGRHCAICKKEVFDFSNKTIAEFNAVKQSVGELCGNFRAEQMEPHLHLIEFRAIRRGKYWLATISTFLGLSITSLKAQDKTATKTEQHDPSKQSEQGTNKNNVCYVSEKPDDPITDKKKTNSYKPKKFYWSWHFPFIHRRHTAFRGNVRNL